MVQGFQIIDAHCHVYPDKIAEKAADNTGVFYHVGHEMDGKVGTLAVHAKQCGIDHCVIQSVATTPAQVRSINEFIARTVAADPRHFTGLGTLHPDSNHQRGDVEHLVALGLHGVKLHPEIQRFALDEPRSLEIFALCEEFGLPLLLHTGDKRYDCSNPNRLIPVLERFPRLTVIGAHLGGWSIWEEAAHALQGIPNLWFDCSSTFAWLDPQIARDLILLLGTDRVLFGTDYPMWTPAKELATFLSLDFTQEQRLQILAENAKRVFRITVLAEGGEPA